MRVLLQRVSAGSVSVDGEIRGEIQTGYVRPCRYHPRRYNANCGEAGAENSQLARFQR